MGFRPGDSTTNQILYLVNEIHQAFESLKALQVFLDISKAFDKVWHNGQIFKLKQNGVSDNLIHFFQNYLDNRNQRVVLNGCCSNYSTVESGVPQGSVLGLLLFLIYINNLERNIKSNIKFFADDTMLFCIVTDPAISANDMNHDLDIIHQWKMQFNPDRNKQATEVLFSSKKSSPNHPQLIFNGTAVTKVNEQKHLGLILEPTLSFEKHLNEKIMKAKKMLEYSTIFSNPQKHINTCVRPMTKSIFGIHDPVGLRYLFQLRVSLSPLRSHKWRHNFIDTPPRYVGVIKAMKTQIISFVYVLSMQFKEQP